FFFSSRRRHTRFSRDWSSDVCSSDLGRSLALDAEPERAYRSSLAAGGARRRPGVAPPAPSGAGTAAADGRTSRICRPLAPAGGRSEERRVGKEWGWAGTRAAREQVTA